MSETVPPALVRARDAVRMKDNTLNDATLTRRTKDSGQESAHEQCGEVMTQSTAEMQGCIDRQGDKEYGPLEVKSRQSMFSMA